MDREDYDELRLMGHQSDPEIMNGALPDLIKEVPGCAPCPWARFQHGAIDQGVRGCRNHASIKKKLQLDNITFHGLDNICSST